MNTQDWIGKSVQEIAESLNAIDDIFFHKIMEDIMAAQELIRTVLEDDSIEIVSVKPQDYIRNLGKRSVILDAKCINSNGAIFNVEVQRRDDTDHQSRVRFNAASIDTSCVEAGTKFQDLPDVYMIYICDFDLFKGEKACYHINRVVKETGETVYNGIHEIYLNAKSNDGTKISELLHFLTNTKGSNDNFPEISRRANYFRKEGKKELSDVIDRVIKDHVEEERQEARAEGRAEFLKEKVSKKLQKGMDAVTIADILEEDVSVVQGIIDELKDE